MTSSAAVAHVSAAGAPKLPERGGDRADPLAAVLALGLRASRIGLVAGGLLALAAHSAAIGGPAMSLLGMRQQVRIMREQLHRYFWSEYDVSLVDERAPEPEAQTPEPEAAEPPEATEDVPKAVEPPPEPEPEQEPEQEPDDPYQDDEPPPAPAEAADILEAPDDAVDLSGSGWSMVDKDGSTKTGGGYTSAKGTASSAVRNPAARVGGKPGGKGGGAPKPHKAHSRAQPATLLGGRSWSCPFPPQADVEQVDRATTVVAVTVGPDGRARSARVLADPGYGFGQAARRCALARRYRPARNASGQAITSTTPPIRVRFRR